MYLDENHPLDLLFTKEIFKTYFDNVNGTYKSNLHIYIPPRYSVTLQLSDVTEYRYNYNLNIENAKRDEAFKFDVEIQLRQSRDIQQIYLELISPTLEIFYFKLNLHTGNNLYECLNIVTMFRVQIYYLYSIQ